MRASARSDAPTVHLLLGLSFLAFVSLGLPDGVLGVAWPSMQNHFALRIDALGPLLVTTTAGYVASSFATGRILQNVSVGGLLALSSLLTGVSLFGFAVAPSWAAIVALGSVGGLGAGAIDAGLNSHVAARHSARALNLLHAFYGVGTTTGPLIMTEVLAAGDTWQRGYLIVAAAQLVLAFCFMVTLRLWPPAVDTTATNAATVSIGGTLRLRAARLGILVFFLYVGLEATAGAWLYSLLHQARAMSMETAAAAASLFWGGLMAGRLVFGLLPDGMRPPSTVGYCIAFAALAAGLLAFDGGATLDLIASLMLGGGCAPVFPLLIASTPRRVGTSHAANAISFQIAAAAAGQSALPALTGTLARLLGLEAVPVTLGGLALLLLASNAALQRSRNRS